MLSRWRTMQLSAPLLTLLLSAWLVLFYNGAVWSAVFAQPHDSVFGGALFVASFFVFLVAALNLFLSLVQHRYVLKPVAIVLLLLASAVAYFMSTYGVVIDKAMIQNVMETDSAEALDLMSGRFVAYFVGLGLLPALLVYRLPVRYRSGWAALRSPALSAGLSLVVVLGVAAALYSDYASFLRNNSHLKLLVTPSNALYSSYKYLNSLNPHEKVIRVVGEDARLGPQWQQREKRSLLVLVVGETARAQNFSLNGYSRQTNPNLSKDGVINFSNVHACGTSTAISVPCMFSRLGHEQYDDSLAAGEESLLDVLAHAGLEVYWRDNNSGCKGACDRVRHEERNAFRTAEFCDEAGCYDEAMLNGLDRYLEQLDRDAVVVLHQLGSHGPTYYKRYPKAFEVFTPVCDSNQLQTCTPQEIANAYDNTILYTDHFLHRVIQLLNGQDDKYDSAVLYLSDHGESLGENHLYLHGMPYFMAPEVQTRVPMELWMSAGFADSFGVDRACLEGRQNEPLSHDNLFHSVLGLLDIETGVYEQKYDLFSSCRRPHPLVHAAVR